MEAPATPVVLVVEDEPVLRASMVRGLARLPGDVTVVGAGSVGEARRLIDADPPQLVISDINLPDGTGIELIDELERRSLRIPVIFASAYVPRFRSKIPTRAWIHVREKPIPLAELRELVAQQLRPQTRPSEVEAPFSAMDYVQLGCMCRKSVEVSLESARGVVGRIYVIDGELWTAVDATDAGMGALRRLLFARGLTVRCAASSSSAAPQRTITGPWDAVLLETARTHDERSRTVRDEDWDDVLPEADRTPVSPAPVPDAPPSAEVTLGFEYERAERRLRDYEREHAARQQAKAARDERPARPPEAERGPLSYARARFDELFDAGVEALLAKDYGLALRHFTQAGELDADDPRVRANLERLRAMGVR